jgi:hypothetical protein
MGLSAMGLSVILLVAMKHGKAVWGIFIVIFLINAMLFYCVCSSIHIHSTDKVETIHGNKRM